MHTGLVLRLHLHPWYVSEAGTLCACPELLLHRLPKFLDWVVAGDVGIESLSEAFLTAKVNPQASLFNLSDLFLPL